MTLTELIAHLERIRRKHGSGTAVVNVLLETEDCQYEFPANDVAYSRSTGTVIIMHEREKKP